MSRTFWAWLRLLAGGGILAVLVARLGTGPFLNGLRTINAWSLAAAALLTLGTTVCSAWRWRVVARGLGVGLPLAPAAAAYYRSQFLNTVLPGGILGDVHRAVSHGRDVGDVGRSLRAVAWERSAGQVLQVVVTLAVLLVLPSPVRPFVPLAVAVVVGAAAVAALVLRTLPHRGPSRAARAWRGARSDVRAGLLAPRAWPAVTVASLLVIAGHTGTFFVAARTSGVTAPTVQMLPLVMLVMLAMAVPTNIGGWGPREGAAAWLFGVAGLGAAHGVAAATVYGVLVLAATLPGAAVLLVAWVRPNRPLRPPPEPVEVRPAAQLATEASGPGTAGSPEAEGLTCG
jgi:glycosyltransferase 2 family protein